MNGSKIWSVILAALAAGASRSDSAPLKQKDDQSEVKGTAAAGGALESAASAELVNPATVPVLLDWSGFYVGIEGGYGWGHEILDSAHDSFGVSGGVGCRNDSQRTVANRDRLVPSVQSP